MLWFFGPKKDGRRSAYSVSIHIPLILMVVVTVTALLLPLVNSLRHWLR